MRIKICSFIFCTFLISCITMNQYHQTSAPRNLPIMGTWQLISGIIIQGKDTTTTYYSKERSFIKIINDTHFAFLEHDLNKGKDSNKVFTAGGGSYSLKNNVYTEHLEYCSDRNWEGNSFEFTIKIEKNTLTQSGIEKIEDMGIDRVNVEKYVKVKDN